MTEDKKITICLFCAKIPPEKQCFQEHGDWISEFSPSDYVEVSK